jgi:hypothetical protein
VIRRVVVVAACLLPACRGDSKPARPPATALDAAPSAATRKPTDPDPDYERNRAELLKRGNPDLMKDMTAAGGIPDEASATDLVKSVSKDVMMVKSIRVDLAHHRMEIPGKVITPTTPLEFIAVGPKGKTYESMFEVDATAVEVRLALTLLGHDGATPDDKGDVPPPSPGDTMRVLVKVGDKEHPLSDFLVRRSDGKRAADLVFQVIGFRDADKAAALSDPQFVSLVSHEVYAPLRVTVDAGNPYAGPDQGLAASKKAPPVGSAITLVLEDATR